MTYIAWSDSWRFGSWGLSWEANQELLLVGGGGPDASDSHKGYTETEADLEHIERKAEHGRRMYQRDVVANEAPIPPSPEQSGVEPARETPALFYSEPAVDVAAVGHQLDAAQAVVADITSALMLKKQQEEEALILILAEAA